LTETKLSTDGSQDINSTSTPALRGPNQDVERTASDLFSQEGGDYNQDSDSSAPAQPPSKKPRIAVLRKEESIGLSQLSIESTPDDEDSQDLGLASLSTSTPSSPMGTDQKSSPEYSSGQSTPIPGPNPKTKAMAVVEFNKNTENMITIYFKSGLGKLSISWTERIG
jgi:hypothetical protein